MNNPVMKNLLPFSRFAASGLCTLILLGAAANLSHALIPEPDNILYGAITLDNLPVTAAHTNVVVEARRTTNGPAIARYRMGSDAQIGDFYSLKLALESVAPVTEENASETGETLIIVLRDTTGIRGQTNFTFGERGFVQRADFGLALLDGDGDGLPDAWELHHFGNLGSSPGSVMPNGQTALQHFVAGTNPNDPQGGFRLHINLTNDLKRVWFVAAQAEGPGYNGMTRRYTLEYRPNLAAGFWTEVPGYIDVPGNNQTVSYFTTGVGAPGYYRGRISLVGFGLPGTPDGAPVLTILPAGPGLATLSWTPNTPGFVLQETWSLISANWTNSLSGSANPVTVTTQSPTRYYRVFKP